jgi:uncharacterized protein YggL (DUF469 family)
MKPMMLLALGLFNFTCIASDATNPAVAPLIILGAGRLPDATNYFEREIVTRDGHKFESAHIRKVEPDGITIEYSPSPAGVGIAKVQFTNLSTAIQNQYAYDPDKASNFQAQKVSDLVAYKERQRIEEAQREFIEAQLAKRRFEIELELSKLKALERLADAAEFQNHITRQQLLEQQLQTIEASRIADGIDDLRWNLALKRYGFP